MKFKIGDRVIVSRPYGRWSFVNRMVGTIVCFDDYYGVEFDKGVDGHDCGGNCKNRLHGLWFKECDLKLYYNWTEI